MKNVRSSSACALIALFACLTPAEAQTQPSLPDGWERPSSSDLAGANMEFRKKSPGRYLKAEADFDGDGVVDTAELLVNRIAKTYALYAFLSKFPTPIELADGRIGNVQAMAISTAKPGRTQTTCGKGYDSKDPGCKKGVPFVDIPLPSIELFGFESGGSQFYWTGEKFERVWTSE